jgi:uncharacterized membrane protein
VSAVTEAVLVEASLAETWDYYFEPHGWPAWVEGFKAVESAEGYPHARGRLRWRSTAAGRGTVDEEVLAHEPRSLHRITFSDPQSSGELETRFQVQGEGTRVEQHLSYRLRKGGPLSFLTDRLFVRPQVRRSVQRSLLRLKREAEEVADRTTAA